MEDEIDENAVLDYAIFNTSATQNSYEAVACSKGKMETVASGPLDHLALHLSVAKECQASRSCSSFKLQLVENQKGSVWFTKVTLARFLRIVNTPNALKAASVIEGEMSQLEETKRFHISLYAKDQDRYTGVTADTNCLKEAGQNQKIKAETASSDATKNELLRALDLRLLALEEELATLFNRAAEFPYFSWVEVPQLVVYDLPKSMFAQILDGGNSSNRSMEFQGTNEYVSAQSTARPSTILDRLREGQNSASTTSTKATRSVFSLSQHLGAANQVRRSFDNAQLSYKSLWK